MPIALIHPNNLRCLHEDCEVEEVDLEVEDNRDDYYTENGDGVWIRAFLEFVEDLVRERCQLPNFNFSDSDNLNDDILKEIEDPYFFALVVRFANKNFEAWRDKDVSLPDYDDVRSDCRSYCDDCESGWEETRGTYDGPLAEDVSEDEIANETGITEEERAARRQRNLVRAHERQRREQAQEDAESEVVDRDFVCEDDCDGFSDHLQESFMDRVDTRLDRLKERWERFLEESGEDPMPDMKLLFADKKANAHSLER